MMDTDITNQTKKTINLRAYKKGTGGVVNISGSMRPGKSIRISEEYNDIYIKEVI